MRLIEGVFPDHRPERSLSRWGAIDSSTSCGEVAFPARRLHEIVKPLPDKDALLKRASSNHLQVRGHPLAHPRTLGRR